ncbi:hypothetical protein BC827DRAFT_129770, partial [Russula dissimulans]
SLVDNQQLRTRPPYTHTQSLRGAGAVPLSILFYLFPSNSYRSLFLFPPVPRPFKCPMACPFPQASDRHPTPPLSPSTSSDSSRESPAPFLSPSRLSTLLPRVVSGRLPPCPDLQPLEHCDRTFQLGLMTDRLDDDTVMLDDWEENEHERPERAHEASRNNRLVIGEAKPGTAAGLHM